MLVAVLLTTQMFICLFSFNVKTVNISTKLLLKMMRCIALISDELNMFLNSSDSDRFVLPA